MIENMQNDPQNSDYWYNDEIPAEWYRTFSNSQIKPPSPLGNEVKNEADNVTIKRGVPFRIEFPLEKSKACKRLMGHAFILRAIVQLLATPSFIPTWDSFVFKVEGEGVPIKWHRDASMESVNTIPAIDIGYYLDPATVQLGNCLWVIPGSHKWPDFLAAQMIEHLISEGFSTSGASPVEALPGDVVFHNILLLHGSKASNSPLRRTVYFEYRAISQEREKGPHVPAYIPLKQRVLQACLHERSLTSFDAMHGEHEHFNYAPQGDDAATVYDPNCPPPTLRYPHAEYFRDDYRG